MAKLSAVTMFLAAFVLVACDSDSGSPGTTVGEVSAGEGLTGGGSGAQVSLAVDFNAVARKSHVHPFAEITGVPNATTAGAKCAAGQKATGIDVSQGTVSCAADADTLAALSCADGKVAKFQSGAWACADDATAAGGGVTSVTGGAGLLGGQITSSGTLSVDFTAVAAAMRTFPDLVSPWTIYGANSIQYNGSVGIGRGPSAALDVDSTNAQLLLHDRAGLNTASVLLEDADNAGGTLNVIFQRSDHDVLVTSSTIFMAADNSLAYQTDGTAHRFKISPSVEAMRIADNGFVGIGTRSPQHLLEVSNGVTTASCDGTNWINASSRAAKEGIRSFADADYRRIRRWLDETQVVWYRYRGDRDPRTRVGLIAEDVPAVLATADRKGISTADAVGFLTAASKQLAAENQRLEQENRALSERLARLEERLNRLERRR